MFNLRQKSLTSELELIVISLLEHNRKRYLVAHWMFQMGSAVSVAYCDSMSDEKSLIIVFPFSIMFYINFVKSVNVNDDRL